MVTAGSGDQHRRDGIVVADYVSEIAGVGLHLDDRSVLDRLDDLWLELAAVPDGRITQRRDRHNPDPRHQLSLLAVARGHHHRGPSSLRGRDDSGQDARDGPQPAIETELAQMHDPVDRLTIDKTRSGKAGEGNAEVERGSLLG